MKKILLGVLFCSLIFAAAVVLEKLLDDPNFMLKQFSENISVDETQDISFDNGVGVFSFRKKLPVYTFTPDESTEYTFTVTDLTVNNDGILSLLVMDETLEDYLDVNSADNKTESDDAAGTGDSFSGTVLLTEGETYYVGFGMIPGDEYDYDFDKLAGTFKLTITKAVQETAPAELETDGTVKLTVCEGGQAGALFRPESNGFYKFTTRISSKNKTSGYSSVTSITSAEKKKVQLVDGICYLETGTDYYVWVSVYELNDKSAEVILSCNAVDFIKADETYDFDISKDTIIEYRSETDQDIAVYSDSDGDPKATVYDSSGFPVASDDSSGGSFSENDKGFALVLIAQAKESYWIYVSGDFETCKVRLAKYTGDGTSLGPDDISPLDPDDAVSSEKDENADMTADDGAAGDAVAEESDTVN